jgi:hypothetical protein
MANDEYLVSAGALDFLDHLIELIFEARDGVCTIGVLDVRERVCVKNYVRALTCGTGQPLVYGGLIGLKSADENNVDFHLLLRSQK